MRLVSYLDSSRNGFDVALMVLMPNENLPNSLVLLKESY